MVPGIAIRRKKIFLFTLAGFAGFSTFLNKKEIAIKCLSYLKVVRLLISAISQHMWILVRMILAAFCGKTDLLVFANIALNIWFIKTPKIYTDEVDRLSLHSV